MEDKIVVTVPQIRLYSGLKHLDARSGWEEQLGRNVTAHQALTRQIMQFLHGAPVVDYGLIEYAGTAPGNDSRLLVLDTIQRNADISDPLSTVSTTSYSQYTNYLFQNKANASKAIAGRYVLAWDAGGYFVIYTPGFTSTLKDETGAQQQLNPGDTKDFYYDDGNGGYEYWLTVGVGPISTGNAWSPGQGFYFNVITPDYNEDLNWSKPSRHWNMEVNSPPFGANGYNGYLVYDTGRLGPHTGSDTFADANMVTLNFATSNTFSYVAPVDNWTANLAGASSSFWDAGAGFPWSANGIISPLTAGLASSTDPATANRMPDKFTMFRGPGYIRIMGETRDPNNLTQTINPDMDSMYFYGMMTPLAPVDLYPSPVAFLGNLGIDMSGTAPAPRPWWRTSNGPTATTDASMLYTPSNQTGRWQVTAPFILKPSFNLNGGTASPTQVFQLSPLSGYRVPDLSASSSSTSGGFGDGSVNIGASNTGYAEVIATTDFTPTRIDLVYSTYIGYNTPQYRAGYYLEAFGGPQIRPMTIYDLSEDGYAWAHPGETGGQTLSNPTFGYQGERILAKTTSGLNTRIETFGFLPGVYHGSELVRFDPAGDVTRTNITPAYALSPGTLIEYKGRQLRVIVGANPVHGGTYSRVNGVGYNTGVILFDMNAV